MSARPGGFGGRTEANAREWNFDALVGPTHNYAGLSPGNLASEAHRGRTSNPRAAALQGLDKMKRLHALGVPQAILPPHPRPALAWLRRLGFGGGAGALLEDVARDAPTLLSAAWSASSMWAANTATVSPSADTHDGRVHFTPANLSSELHRGLEAGVSAEILRRVFADPAHFVHHDPLPAFLSDEGAANHLRFAPDYGAPGFQVFVYGVADSAGGSPGPRLGRQREAAGRSVARQHGLDPARVAFVQQHPAAIAAGVFHNDVIATGDRDWLWLHEEAWAGGADTHDALRDRARAAGVALRIDVTPADSLPLAEAVATYLYNCQLVRGPGGERVWIGPEECRDSPRVEKLLEARIEDGTLSALCYADLRQSMHNGGGPACLRLRVVLTPRQEAVLPEGIVYSEERHRALAACIESRYRDRVTPRDLADAAWAQECLDAQRELCALLGLDGVADLDPGEEPTFAMQHRTSPY